MILIKMPSLEAVEIFNNVTAIEPQYPWRETKWIIKSVSLKYSEVFFFGKSVNAA